MNRCLVASICLLLALPSGIAQAQQVYDSDGNCVSGCAGGVGSFSAGSTGLTPSSPAVGALVLGGILAPAYGGTGIANDPTNTLTFSGHYSLGLTLSGATGCAPSSCAALNALNPMAVTNRPPQIPPLPHRCIANSPYSNASGMRRCA